MLKNVRTGLFVATAVFVALAPAQAWAKCNILKPSTCVPKVPPIPPIPPIPSPTDLFNTAAQGVGYANAAAAQAAGYADKAALEAANNLAKANAWSNVAAADAASKAMGFKNYAERMARDSETVGRDQYEGLRNDAVRNYTNASNQAKNIYENGRSIVAPVINNPNSLANYVKGVCVGQATGNWGKITPFVNKALALNDDGKKALYRVLRTLGRGSTPDQQTAADMKVVGQALGMVTTNGLALVGNAYQSNWGISLGTSGGWVAGVNGSVSFSMDTYPTNGKYKMAVAVNSGVQVAAGVGILSPGATIGFGLGWGPGSSVDASGVTMTLGGAVGGIDVGAQWTIPPVLATAMVNDASRGSFSAQSLQSALTGQLDANIQAVCQAPGISAGVSIPTSGNMGDATFSPGYTHVVWTGSVNQ